MKTYKEFLITENKNFDNLENSQIYQFLYKKYSNNSIKFIECLIDEEFPLNFIRQIFEKFDMQGILSLEEELILFKKLYTTNKQKNINYLDVKILDEIISDEDYVLHICKLGFSKIDAKERLKNLKEFKLKHKIKTTIFMDKDDYLKLIKELNESI